MNVNAPLSGYLQMDLSNYSKGVRLGDDPTDFVFPRVPVLRQTDSYLIAGREILQRDVQTLRAPGDGAAEIRFAFSRDTYFTSSRALSASIPDERRGTWPGDINQYTTNLLQNKILHDRAYRAMQKVTNPANYASSNTLALSGGAQWDQSSSDPLGIGKKARTVIAKGVAVRPNNLLLGFDVAEALRVNTQLLQRFQYTTVTGQLTDQQLAQIFGVDRVLVGGTVSVPAGAPNAVYNPLNPTPNTFDWSNFALFFYSNPAGVGPAGVYDPTKTPVGSEGLLGPGDVSFGKSFTWTGAPGTVDGYGVLTWRDPNASAKTDHLSVDWYSDEKITGADAGYLVTNVLATPGGN
jgi:hypothetical protein